MPKKRRRTKSKDGLVEKDGVWHVDKYIGGERIRKSTGTSERKEAEEVLALWIRQSRKARVFGERPERRFADAASRYMDEFDHLACMDDHISHLKTMMPYIGHKTLPEIHDGTLASFIEDAKRGDHRRGGRPLKPKSVNNHIQVVQRIMNLSARVWRDENNLTWLEQTPLLTRVPIGDTAARAYPLARDEQRILFKNLPVHLAVMAEFAVNTGAREAVICGLKWKWERKVTSLGVSVFTLPASIEKNGRARLLICNSVAQSILESQRDQDDEFVFTYLRSGERSPVTKMNNTAWQRAWKASELPTGSEWKKGVHNLRHTFGRRLRAAGVSLEDRKDLLGHWQGNITTDYSAPEIGRLLEAANKVCESGESTPTLAVIARGSA